MQTPAFASDPATAHCYDRRTAEYDEWYTAQGIFVDLVRHLPPARTLDVACGTAFLTRHLRGFVVGLDQSPAMVAIAQSRLPDGLAVVGDALHLMVADHAFDRVMTGHFYGHLPPEEQATFLGEAHRVAVQLIVIDSAWRPGVETDQWQERVLSDGSRHQVYKRYLSGTELAGEIDGEVLRDGTWFVVARVSWMDQ